MLSFMDHVQQAFYTASSWDVNNCYETLTATAKCAPPTFPSLQPASKELTRSCKALLDFDIPSGVQLNVSSLSTPNFATSYTVGSKGLVDGSLSYLYTSLPLSISSASATLDLGDVVQSYRHVAALRRPADKHWAEIWYRGRRIDRKGRARNGDPRRLRTSNNPDTLLYGRLHLPRSALEALYLRRISPTGMLRLAAVSDSSLPGGGALLATIQNDHAKYSTEYLFGSDSALVGIRGLYNFGFDPRMASQGLQSAVGPDVAPDLGGGPGDAQKGRLSAGAEFYFSPVNKSGGMSTAVRFTTLRTHTGFPYTMTLTFNPLMGNISSAWASRAGQNLSLCSRFNFNFYSYESDVQLGMQLWRRGSDADGSGRIRDVDAERGQPEQGGTGDRSHYDSVVRVKASQDRKIGILWEGRIQGLLASIGGNLDLKRTERVVGSVGVEFSYSS